MTTRPDTADRPPPLRTTDATAARVTERASDDRALAYRILDDAFVCHVGFVVDDRPFVIPMVFARDGDRLLLHGSVATRLTRQLQQGIPVCVTVTHVDGIVVAKSAFHHSVNYRSVVVLGVATRLDHEELSAAFDTIVDHAIPGRSDEARRSNGVETRQTAVLAVPIDEASVKTRTGGPKEDPDDEELDIWNGVLPLRVVPGAAEPAGASAARPVPASLSPWTRPGVGGGA